MVTINRLKKSDLEYFASMDPNGLLDKISIPGTAAFGASTKGPEGDVPSGLMILSEVYGRFAIEWLYVDPEEKYKGIGEALLLRAFECADRLGYEQLSAIISEGNLKAGEMDAATDYLEDRLFCTQEPFFGEYILSAEDIKSSPLLKKDLSIYPDLCSLEQAGDAVLQKLMDMSAGGKLCCLYPIRGMAKFFDERCSSVLVDDGEVYGAFILQNTGDAYVSVLSFAEDEKSKEILLVRSMNEIARTSGSGAELQIMCPDRTLSDLLEKHFPGNKSQTVLLTADLEEYKKLLDDL